MDLIYQSLLATLQADPQMENDHGFLVALLNILKSEALDKNVQHAGAIYFKNSIQQNWSKDSISEADRKAVRDDLLPLLFSKINAIQIRSQILTAFGSIIHHDISQNAWPDLLTRIQSMLMNQDMTMVHAGLLALSEVAKVYQWSSGTKRAPLNYMIDSTFPGLLIIANALLPNNTYQSGEMVKILAKIFCGSIRLELSSTLQKNEILSGWVSLFLQVIQKDLSSVEAMPPTDMEKEKYPWIKAKKWAYQSIYHLYSRYCRALRKDKKYAAFSKIFMDHYIPKILEAYLHQLERIKHGFWTSEKEKNQLGIFFEEWFFLLILDLYLSVKPKPTWLALKPHLETIVVHFIFPMLCFSESDHALWNDDPIEFINKRLDPPLGDSRSAVTAAEELLGALVKDRFKQTFSPIMAFLNVILMKYQNSDIHGKDPREKDGVLRIMSLLCEETMSDESPILPHLEDFLIAHVYPELNSPHGFLRSRACEVIRNYGELDFKKMEPLVMAFQRILECMKDPDMPVRVSASMSIPSFLRHDVIHDALKPHAHAIMQELLNLTNEIDMDTLTHVMEQLVTEYSEELMPFAVKLGTQMTETFLRIMAETNLDSEDLNFEESESKIMAAMGVLKTLSSLVMSVEASKTILAELELAIAPAIVYVLKHNILDLFEETFELIELCTYCSKSISPMMWEIFDLIFSSLGSDAFEYAEEVTPTLDNYLSFGHSIIKENPEFQNRFIQFINGILSGDADYVGETDKVRAFQLMEGMMLNLKPNIDIHIPWFIFQASVILGDVEKSKSVPVRVHALEVVINALYYNAPLTLLHLEEKNGTGAFFDLWLKNIEHFTRVHDKKLSILTICNLLELPVNALPGSLQSNWTFLFESLLKFFESYGEALEEREKERRIQEGESESESDEEVEDETSQSVPNGFSDPDEDCPDEDEEYLELLEEKAESHDLLDDEEDDDWSLDLMMEEDIYFTTILDKIDAYNRFEDLMSSLSVIPDLYSHLNNALSASQKTFVESLIVKSREIKAKQ